MRMFDLPPINDPTWVKRNNRIHLSVESDGTTGREWISRLSCRGKKMNKDAVDILLSPNFQPTNGITYYVAIYRSETFALEDRTFKNIELVAKRDGRRKAHPEVACLIRERYTDDNLRQMGFDSVTVVHDRIINPTSEDHFMLTVFNAGDHESEMLGVLLGNDENMMEGEGMAFITVPSEHQTLPRFGTKS